MQLLENKTQELLDPGMVGAILIWGNHPPQAAERGWGGLVYRVKSQGFKVVTENQ